MGGSKPAQPASFGLLKAKRTARLFYPSKGQHCRRVSQNFQQQKIERTGFSPLNRSHDSTCDSISGCSSSKDGSGAKPAQCAEDEHKELQPIRLEFEDDGVKITPSLIVEVVSNTEGVNYQLENKDVRKVFEKFGSVASVEVIENARKAIVVMEDLAQGKQAEKYLNFYKLANSSAYLTVKWQFGDYEELQKINELKMKTEGQNREFENEDFSTKVAGGSLTVPDDTEAYTDDVEIGVNKECTSLSKFT